MIKKYSFIPKAIPIPIIPIPIYLQVAAPLFLLPHPLPLNPNLEPKSSLLELLH